MSGTTATEMTEGPALTGRYGAIGILAVSAALMFTGRAAGADQDRTGKSGSLPVFVPVADYLRY